MSSILFSFADYVLRVCPDVGDSTAWKVVRHMDNRPGAPDLFELTFTEAGRTALEFYQAEQSKDIFGRCKGFFAFVGLRNKRALFLGAYLVRAVRRQALFTPAEVPIQLREFYRIQNTTAAPGTEVFVYELEQDKRFVDLERRVVIDWGDAAVSFHQYSLDKPVVELRDPESIGECPDYREVEVTLAQLEYIFAHEAANSSWKDRLAAVGGIYLLTNRANGKVYVGQAESFWSRWRAYANQQTGNVDLDPAFASGELTKEDTTLSILDVVPRGTGSAEELNLRENRWKIRVGSRFPQIGYNRK
jgi:hypothetical protein